MVNNGEMIEYKGINDVNYCVGNRGMGTVYTYCKIQVFPKKKHHKPHIFVSYNLSNIKINKNN
ncbi:hypothetical protein CL614_03615 [archaeon]|nr:hypothetical protein [archaeon]|tara:strand:- start:376 stop:564 length:189 start_codon:yes stop_codon:yes gene_type:complete